MGKLNINNGGVDTNKKMPDIDERFGPYSSIEAADAALGGQGRNTITAGLTVGILQANGGVKEYWYQPNKKSGILELIPKGGNAADNPTEGNFASFDSNGNVVDSGNKASDFAPIEQAVPNGDTEDEGKILEKQKNGFGWVDKPVDGARGKSAREIYNQEKGTDYDDARFIEAIKANYPMKYVGYNSTAYSATSPFDSIGSLDADETTECKLWFMPNNDNTETKLFITVNKGTAESPSYKWYNMGVVDFPSNVLTEEMVDNECTNGTVDTPASAKAVMDLKAKLEGVTASESKVITLTEEDKAIDGSTGALCTDNYGTHCVITLGGTKKVRFLAAEVSGSSYPYGYCFYDNNGDVISDSMALYNVNSDSATRKVYEIIADVPEDAVTFKFSISSLNRSTKYCYLQSGRSVGEELADKASYSEMEGLWMWKKNLFDSSRFLTGHYYMYNKGTWWQTNANGIISQPIVLQKDVTYTASNVVLYSYPNNTPEIGDTGKLIIGYYDSSNNLITCKSFSGEVTGIGNTTSYLKAYGECTFIYNEDDIEGDVAYVRFNIRGGIGFTVPSSPQLEVGTEVTEPAPYNSEKVFNVTNEQYVDKEIEGIHGEINEEIGEVTITETQVEDIDSYQIDGNEVYLNINGEFKATITGNKTTRIDVQGYDKVRFLGITYPNTITCYGFQDKGNNFIKIYNYGSAPSNTKEISLLVPEKAKYLVCLIAHSQVSSLESSFYCYVQKGLNISNRIDKLEDNTKEYVNEDIGNDEFITIQGKRLNYEVESGTNMEVSSSNTNYATSYRLYPVEQGVKYFFSGAIKTSYNVPRYPIIFLSETTDLTQGYQGTFNKSEALGVGFGEKDGKIIAKPATLWTHVNEELEIPEGCNTIAINIWTAGVQKPFKLIKQNEVVYTTKDLVNRISTIEANEAKKTKLNVIAIGNSFTVDSVAYLPYLMHRIAPEVDFGIDLLMESSSTLTCLVLDYLHARHNDNVADEYKYPHVVTRTGNTGSEGEYMYQDGRSYRWFHYNKTEDSWEQKYDNTQSVDTSLFTIQSILLNNNEVYDVVLINSSYWSTIEGQNGGYNPNTHGIINLISEDLNYPVKFGCLQTFSNLRSMSNDELQWDEDKIFDSNGNYISDIEYNNGNFVKYVANLFRVTVGTVNNILGKSIVSFKIPVNTAFNNAYTWSKIRNLGSFNNGSHDGYLRIGDSATHLMHGLPRQLAAYTCMLKLLELVGVNQKSIIGDTYMLDATTLIGESKLDLTPPSGDNIGFDGEDKFDNLKFIQKCAVAAVNNPDVITNINAMHDDVCYIQFNLQEVSHSGSTVTVEKGSSYSTTLSPNTNSYVFDGEVEVYMNSELLENVVNDNGNGTKTVTISSVTGDVVIIAKAILSNT